MRHGATLVALMLVAAACGGTGGSDPLSGPLLSSSSPFSGPGGTVSPLVRFFDAVEGLEGGDDKAVELRASRIYADTLVRCMKEHGFEYYIDPVARIYGTADPTPQDSDGFGLAVPPPDGEVVTVQSLDEKNAEYVASLSDEARTEYQIALWGYDPSLPPGSEGGPPLGDGQGSDTYRSVLGGDGCEGDAGVASEEYLQAHRADSASDDALKERLQDLLDEYVGEVEADGDVLAALGDYQTCMTTAGFAIRHPESALTLVYEAPQEIIDLLAAEGADILERLQNGDIALDDPEASAFRGREIEARDAHERCAEQVVDAVFAFDRRFLDEHRDILAQYAPADE